MLCVWFYSDTDSDYEIALIVARMDSLKDRREILTARFFQEADPR